ncbi:DUF2065 family protein [Mesorhizobium microcysteis]|uniref:DUF2065 family protein n=1 Tax=Neoaquamicrobium microcysteis TaxID=2682781 RepID=A0A5D4GX12_9HYPH|nr:DUF2065 family protein [Mesorhizobium microcysteis]TYR32409.1 DUF2065 family protein [Mesorhizobium microcysteis]
MSDLLVALGLVLVIEGVLYGGLPQLARRLAADVLSMPEQVLRVAGLVAIAAGVAIVWLVRG